MYKNKFRTYRIDYRQTLSSVGSVVSLCSEGKGLALYNEGNTICVSRLIIEEVDKINTRV